MKLYQWRNEGLDQPTAEFIGTLPGDGTEISCGYCGHTFNCKEHDSCPNPNCGRDIIFPRAEW